MQRKLDARLRECRRGARELSSLNPKLKSSILIKLAEILLDRSAKILAANQRDLDLLPRGTSSAFVDRLTLTEGRLKLMAESLRKVAKLEDPVGEVVESRKLRNGLRLKKVRSPLGVIFLIFEARPNVITEAFSLAFKSGNIIILRGGRESSHSARALYGAIRVSLRTQKLSENFFWGISEVDRKIPNYLLTQRNFIDVVVPRGGESLIEHVIKQSRIPIIKNDRGLCHTYVHADADIEMAVRILVNAKTQRPGVCNSMETILIHRNLASLVEKTYEAMRSFEVKWYVCPRTWKLIGGKSGVFRAKEKSWATEYLEQKVNCRIVESKEEALDHIEKYGSRHSEAILTKSVKIAREFEQEVDAAAVYWNASTRFTDGLEFGLGGELGISTQKLHVRGPVGLRELTSLRWIVEGTGQIRE